MKNRHKKRKGNGHVRHIVVHNTGTRPDMRVRELDKLPYHFIITRGGKLLNLKPVRKEDKTVEVAWLGGLDRYGRHTDNRTEEQSDTLFDTLVLLTDRFPEAQITPADNLYLYGYANPGFDLIAWLNDYIPAFLAA